MAPQSVSAKLASRLSHITYKPTRQYKGLDRRTVRRHVMDQTCADWKTVNVYAQHGHVSQNAAACEHCFRHPCAVSSRQVCELHAAMVTALRLL